MAVKRWPALARGSSDTYSIDWNSRLPSGSSVSSVTHAADPDDGMLTLSSESVASNVSSVTITANENTEDPSEYLIKATPTLDSGAISAVSVSLTVVKHKPAE